MGELGERVGLARPLQDRFIQTNACRGELGQLTGLPGQVDEQAQVVAGVQGGEQLRMLLAQLAFELCALVRAEVDRKQSTDVLLDGVGEFPASKCSGAEVCEVASITVRG